jgi:hypothetical protein
LADIAPGTRFALHLGQAAAPGLPRPLESLTVRAFRSGFDGNAGGDGFVVSRHDLPVDATPCAFAALRAAASIAPPAPPARR